MTPKEKANEIINKYKSIEIFIKLRPQDIEGTLEDYGCSQAILNCALHAVSLLLGECDSELTPRSYLYWLEVKRELLANF